MALDLLKEATDEGELFVDGLGTKTIFVVTHKDQDFKGLTERGVGLEELIKLDNLFALKHKRLEEDFDDARLDLVRECPVFVDRDDALQGHDQLAKLVGNGDVYGLLARL